MTSAREHLAATPEGADLRSLAAADIGAMSYNELIGLVRETNRFPGGRRSVHLIASRMMLHRGSRVLEIGCATGSTAIELSRLTGCQPTAIDINPRSIEEARRRASEVDADVTFLVADATDVPLDAGSFDAVICGNVTALIENKAAAIAEYGRLLRQGGVLIAAPMYYVRPPPSDLVARVRAAIQVEIPIAYRDGALAFFFGLDLEVYDLLDFEFDDVPEDVVDAACDDILGRPHLSALSSAAKHMLETTYRAHMRLFRENMTLLGFTIAFLRKTKFVEDRDLFTAHSLPRPQR